MVQSCSMLLLQTRAASTSSQGMFLPLGISDIESGERIPTVGTVARLASALGV